MATEPRNAPDEVRRGSHTLSLKTWKPRNCSLLGEHSDHTNISDPIQRWEQWLWGERNRWSVDQHRLPGDVQDWIAGGNLCGGRKLDRTDADRLMCAGFAAVDRGEVVQ